MKTGTVTFPVNGRLGNFLFKAASTFAYARTHGMEFTVPARTHDKFWHPVYLPHLIHSEHDPNLTTVTVLECKHSFHLLPFEEVWKRGNVILDGYWQSEKYFKDYRNEVIEAFGLPWHLNKDVVSIHVRRGDYLKLKYKHHILTKPGIEKAMKEFPGYQFKFFSDDIAWCEANFGDRSDCKFSKGLPELQDLISCSLSEHFIISQSTFGWWAAWLNQNPGKRVVLNHGWFQPGHGGLDISDIVPAEWERMEL